MRNPLHGQIAAYLAELQRHALVTAAIPGAATRGRLAFGVPVPAKMFGWRSICDQDRVSAHRQMSELINRRRWSSDNGMLAGR
ncbi:hypothetical protein [Dactylosporangium sp. CA-233914]|uniref:hypothetical protein n=1 Tax=Dactylosporangium sp. CA-233914 TaxID=3239934 RepID=UPI003D8CE0C3